MNADELAGWARTTFGWHGDVGVSAGPRGGGSQLWRVEVDTDRYALKEIFDEPPTEQWIEAELAFCRIAVEAGARVPASHPGPAGHYLIRTPHNTWVRCYDWVDLEPVRPDAPGTPERLGTLFARLHRYAPPMTVEFDGEPPDPWYGTVPDPTKLVVCHRDLHPENVFVDPAGELTVVDFDDAGPADPGRELARCAFDWFCDRSGADLDAVRAMLTAYVTAGGPGRITEPADFSMLLAARANFTLEQARLAADPRVDPQRRSIAERELAMMRELRPTPRQLTQVLSVCRNVFS